MPEGRRDNVGYQRGGAVLVSGAVLSLLGTGGGASAVTITLNSQYIYALNSFGTASADYRLNTNGNAEASENGGAYGVLEAWCIPAAQAINYECYASLVSGSLSSGTLDTWLPLSSSRTWNVTQATLGFREAIINIGIRRVGTSTILASADITLTAERS